MQIIQHVRITVMKWNVLPSQHDNENSKFELKAQKQSPCKIAYKESKSHEYKQCHGNNASSEIHHEPTMAKNKRLAQKDTECGM